MTTQPQELNMKKALEEWQSLPARNYAEREYRNKQAAMFLSWYGDEIKRLVDPLAGSPDGLCG